MGAKKGHIVTEETRKKIRTTLKGRKHSEKTRKRMCLSQRKIAKEKGRIISIALLGHPVSEETKEKIRESCKNAIVIHHINGNHEDNRPENRREMTPREHAELHWEQGDFKKRKKRKLKIK